MSFLWRRPVLAVTLFAAGFGCISSATDPRCTITAPEAYRRVVAQCVNASEFWQAYFDEIERTASGPIIDFELEMEREVTGAGSGDYDPGWVNVRFVVKNLRTRQVVFQQKAEVRLEGVIFGRFAADATRDEIQRAAFEATEDRIFPHLEIWTNIAALRAMGQERGSADAFVPILEEAAANPWGEAIPDEAGTALERLGSVNVEDNAFLCYDLSLRVRCGIFRARAHPNAIHLCPAPPVELEVNEWTMNACVSWKTGHVTKAAI